MTSENKKYVFAGKNVNCSDIGKWHNLNSHRQISKKPKTASDDFYMMEDPRVAGNLENLLEFYSTNRISVPKAIKDIQSARNIIDVKNVVDTKEVHKNPVENVMKCIKQIHMAIFKTISPLSIFQANLEYMHNRLGYTIDDTNSLINCSSLTKLENMDFDQLDSLCTFNFYGLLTKARLTYLVDGDTFDLVFFVPLNLFTQQFTQGNKRGPRAIFLDTTLTKKGMFVKRRCRLWGADAAEKRTTRGPYATKLFKDLTLGEADSKHWYLYIQCFGDDKYGRLLTRIFEDALFEKPLEDKLLSYRHNDLGSLFKPYFGGTKQTFSQPIDDQKDIPGVAQTVTRTTFVFVSKTQVASP